MTNIPDSPPDMPPSKPTDTKLPVPWGPVSALLGSAALGLVVGLAAAVLIGLIWLLDLPTDPLPVWVALVSTLVLQAGMVVISTTFGPWRRGPVGLLLGPRRLSTLKLFGWALAAFVGSTAISAIYVTFAERISDRLIPEPLPGGVDFSEAAVFSFVSVVILAPFAEELFFRGFLFTGFAKRYGFWVAAVVSALVFGLVHFELARTVPAMLSGIVFAAIYWRSGSLWPAVLAHTSQNAIAFGLAT